MGDKGGKSDMDRLGFFQEMSYITVGDRYKAGQQGSFNEAAGKGRQMLPGGIKLPSALQAGYFTEKFGRMFEGEAYSDPVKLRRMRRLEESKKNLGKEFIPPNGEKLMCGLGNHYGTFSGHITAFSPLKKEGQLAPKPLGKNVLTNPGKKGTGYGYANITLNPYPEHSVNVHNYAAQLYKKETEQHKASLKGGAFRLNMHPIQYFTVNPYHIDKELPPVRKAQSSAPRLEQKPFRPSHPGKRIGGAKMGTFDPYPTHSTDPYTGKLKFEHNIVNKTGKIFIPSQGPKSKVTNSIISQNVLRSHTKYNPFLGCGQ